MVDMRLGFRVGGRNLEMQTGIFGKPRAGHTIAVVIDLFRRFTQEGEDELCACLSGVVGSINLTAIARKSQIIRGLSPDGSCEHYNDGRESHHKQERKSSFGSALSFIIAEWHSRLRLLIPHMELTTAFAPPQNQSVQRRFNHEKSILGLMKRLIFLIPFFLFSVAGAGWAEDFLIPLDDRPANRLFVEQIARIGAPQSRLTSPPRHLLGRLYDPGRSEAIMDWLEERVEPGDTVFLSIDMWLYGGLVASRTAAIDPEQVKDRLRRLESLGERGVFLHVLATIPRLSLRTSEEEAPHERTLANWAAKADLPSVPELLTGRKEGKTLPFPEGVPDAVVMEYLRVRDRNISTIRHLV
ncbi:MAG TPA: DUF4127 family protein, partial [Phycisphaerales bacterium]|nr:DUF4127 family protein [Phycisphaerales bacterium]